MDRTVRAEDLMMAHPWYVVTNAMSGFTQGAFFFKISSEITFENRCLHMTAKMARSLVSFFCPKCDRKEKQEKREALWRDHGGLMNQPQEQAPWFKQRRESCCLV